MKAWLLDRSGAERLLSLAGEQALKPVPTRLSWLYTTGALALFFFAIQFFTGCLLLTVYVPEETLAFKSVQTIEYHARLGWLIRQMHSWGASFIIVVLLLHILKVLWYGTYKRPREFTWFVGMLLLGLSMTFCFSGYLLPWNDLSFWATRVSLDAVKSLPLVGEPLKELICGGKDVSGATLGRFFALHVVILPLLLLAFIGYHLALITWKGISPKTTVTEEIELGNKAALAKVGSEPFFPRQVYRDLIACNLGFALLVTFATWWPWDLRVPADTFNTPDHIKPEWYFLPMYQFLKYFDDNLYAALPFLKGRVDPAFLGVLTINVIGLALFLLPVLDRSKERKITRRPVFATIAFLLFLGVIGMGVLGHVSEGDHWGYRFSSKGYPTRLEKAENPPADAAEGAEEKGTSEEALPGNEEGGGGGPGEDEDDEAAEDDGEGAATPVSSRGDGLADGGTCVTCHDDEHEEWTGSVHHAGGVQCVNCHGGIDTMPPEQFLAALEQLFEADEEELRAAAEEEAEKEREKEREKEKKEREKEKKDEKPANKPAEEEKPGGEEEGSEEKKEVEEPGEEKAEGEKSEAGKAGTEEEAEKPSQEKPGEEKPEEEEEPEEKEPPKPRLKIRWHRSIETPEDKRLFLYSHQGIQVDSRGRPDHPDDDDPEVAGRFCGRCHLEVLEHYLAARTPDSGTEEETGTAHTKVCWDCHDNHEVQKPGAEQWEDEGYTDKDDGLTDPFQKIRKDLDGLDAELHEMEGTLTSLINSGYPVDGNVGEQERFEALKLKARQLRPAVHRLDPGLVSKGRERISKDLEVLSEEISQRGVGRAAAEKSVVTWAWILAVFFSILCFIRLFSLGQSESAADSEPAKKKSSRASEPKKKKRRQRKTGKSGKSRDISDLDDERGALLEPLDSDEDDESEA